jgi:hypothetical protein
MITLSIRPAGRHGLYQAWLGSGPPSDPDGGFFCESGTPLLCGARALLQIGVAPETPLQMRHDGSTTIAMVTTVGVAARLSVREGGSTVRFERWKPYPAEASTRSHKHA